MKRIAKGFWVGMLGGCMYFALAMGAHDESVAGPRASPSAMARWWGADGHRITAQIAQHHLSDSATRAVADLLGPSPLALAQVATWPDEIRSDPKWSRATPWHFITIEDTSSYDALPGVPTSESGITNVVEAILYFESVLRTKDAVREKKVEALRFLVHFVGDVHQPLHVGRGGDLGGNRVSVIWFEEDSNLHKVWDTHLIEKEQLSFTEFATFIDQASAESISTWQNDSLLEWVNESKALRKDVYEKAERKRGDDDVARFAYKYVYQKTDIVKRRLLQGGIRLAGVLNSIYEG